MKKLMLVTVCVGALGLMGCNMATNQGVGAIGGGAAGALLGSTVGSGSGRTAATAVGAVLGTIAGSNIGASMDRPRTNNIIVQQAPIAYDSCARYYNNAGAKEACQRGRDARARMRQMQIERRAYQQGYGR